MLRVIQEALTNVAKHAGDEATAEVIYTWTDDIVLIEVVDDGSATAPAETKGFGLIGMRERVELFGGVFGHESVPEGGFRTRGHSSGQLRWNRVDRQLL